MKYIDTEEMRKNFLISHGKGYIIPEFKLQLIKIVELILNNINLSNLSELDYKVIKWAILKDIYLYWDNYNYKKYDNPLPYFTEVTKRMFSKNYNKNRTDLREQYFYEMIVKQRKDKLNKLNAYNTSKNSQ